MDGSLWQPQSSSDHKRRAANSGDCFLGKQSATHVSLSIPCQMHRTRFAREFTTDKPVAQAQQHQVLQRRELSSSQASLQRRHLLKDVRVGRSGSSSDIASCMASCGGETIYLDYSRRKLQHHSSRQQSCALHKCFIIHFQLARNATQHHDKPPKISLSSLMT